MSQENVDIVQRVLDASDRRDAAAVFAAYDPDIEWDASEAMVAGVPWMSGIFRGHDALRAWLCEWVTAWEVTEYNHEGLIDAGDHFVHFLRFRARGRKSGIELESAPYAQVWTLRDGKIVRMKLYPDRATALEAVKRRE
jgi:ketosteroid isomerase-like protein